MMKIKRRTLGFGALGAVLALAAPVSVLAQGGPQGQGAQGQGPHVPGVPYRHALHGVVKSVNAGQTSLVVTVKRGDDPAVDVTASTDQATRIQIPGAKGRKRPLGTGVFGDLLVGDRVVAQGRFTSATAFAARRIHLIPASRHLQAVGTASVSGTIITVTKSDGSTISFSTDPNTKIRPEGKTLADANGKRVTVVGRRTATTNLATAIVILS